MCSMSRASRSRSSATLSSIISVSMPVSSAGGALAQLAAHGKQGVGADVFRTIRDLGHDGCGERVHAVHALVVGRAVRKVHVAARAPLRPDAFR